MAAHGPDGKLDPVMSGELNGLFDNDAMLQVQLDTYLALLGAVLGGGAVLAFRVSER